MDTDLVEIQNKDELDRVISLAEDIITQNYLCQLDKYEVAELTTELLDIDISEYTRIYKFTKLVSDKKESVIDKLVTVLNAIYTNKATIITLISGHKDYTDYYFGIVSKDLNQTEYTVETQGETLKGVLMGNFPGIELSMVSGEAKKKLISDTYAYDYVSSISGIASIRNEKDRSYDKYVQGIEHLVDSVQGKEYSVIIIADPISAEEIAISKLGYETLYTQLSPFLQSTISFNESESITVTDSYTEGVTETIGTSTSLTHNYSKTCGWSKSSTQGSSISKGSLIGSAVGAVVGGVAGSAATITTGGAAAASVVPAVATTALAGSMIGNLLLGGLGQETSSTTFTENSSVTNSSGITNSTNKSDSVQNSNTQSEAEGRTHGRTVQISNENKTIRNLLSCIDKDIERLQNCEAYGAFNCAAYVVSSDPETNAIISAGYNALMRGDKSSVQASHINNWSTNTNTGKTIKEYLMRFTHPLFYNSIKDKVLFSPASIVNSYELAVAVGLPKKSINGLPVFEMASFGRNVFQSNMSEKNMDLLHIGNLFHMGSIQPLSIGLNLKSMAMHTFITGSTGSGKSNTVYQLLRELEKNKIHYLVIEPAKGEYKHLFGNKSAKVYGTNPNILPLLKLNPFKFPQGIHVLEHIDRIIEIFNVCWPMYAAMPAVLKESVERAYSSSGWDLEMSSNKYSDKLFPTFADVLRELENVVGESAFSEEVKDNYIGSLATRVRSLTNGIYGRIFANDELGDERLFDENVVVDLSRVGSVETKSMIMGVLVMRLEEYRMASGVINAELNHITILEEAHNLLRRTSTEQSGESANLQGKAVEMLANAIAEIRTYGEGFVIVDQAPGLLDLSVIRNTNTKIIMRLPDAEDRNLVGKAANLSEDQIKELAKLPTGVAAIYQNDWLEPVLCKVTYEKIIGFYENDQNDTFIGNRNDLIIINKLLDKVAGEKLDMDIDNLIQKVVDSSISTKNKADIVKIFKYYNKVDLDDISSIIYDIFYKVDYQEIDAEAVSIEDWKNSVVYIDGSILADLSEVKQNMIIECILREQIVRNGAPDDYLDKWYKYLEGEVF